MKNNKNFLEIRKIDNTREIEKINRYCPQEDTKEI